METTDIIAIVCVGLALGYVAYSLYRKAKKGGCGCGSGSCCAGKKDSDQKKNNSAGCCCNTPKQ